MLKSAFLRKIGDIDAASSQSIVPSADENIDADRARAVGRRWWHVVILQGEYMIIFDLYQFHDNLPLLGFTFTRWNCLRKNQKWCGHWYSRYETEIDKAIFIDAVKKFRWWIKRVDERLGEHVSAFRLTEAPSISLVSGATRLPGFWQRPIGQCGLSRPRQKFKAPGLYFEIILRCHRQAITTTPWRPGLFHRERMLIRSAPWYLISNDRLILQAKSIMPQIIERGDLIATNSEGMKNRWLWNTYAPNHSLAHEMHLPPEVIATVS